MVDAGMPLLGLVMRLRTLDELPNLQEVYTKVRNQIESIQEEMRQHDYEPAHISAYSYALCLHIDEAVMRRPWGKNSCWSQAPLLSVFHHETWGGEKLFTVLSRMMQEPTRYKDVLEFIYLCLCLGLKGKYAIEPNGEEAHQAVIDELHGHIRKMRGPVPEWPCDPLANVAPGNYRVKRELRWWVPLVISAVLMVVIYAQYHYRLELLTNEVLESLDGILQQ